MCDVGHVMRLQDRSSCSSLSIFSSISRRRHRTPHKTMLLLLLLLLSFVMIPSAIIPLLVIFIMHLHPTTRMAIMKMMKMMIMTATTTTTTTISRHLAPPSSPTATPHHLPLPRPLPLSAPHVQVYSPTASRPISLAPHCPITSPLHTAWCARRCPVERSTRV